MKPRNEIQLQTVQLFEPDPEAVYSLETTEHIAHAPRRHWDALFDGCDKM
jgi:hypothetical protein